MTTGTGEPVRAAGRAAIGERTLRKDRWWAEPLLTAAGLLSFVVYATWAAFSGTDYYAAPYLSPFYSPCLATGCVEGSAHFGGVVGDWFTLSPALLILVFPLGFRMTCYYYRKAYYRSLWLSPPACAVAEPHRAYTGESRFPLVLQNVHRYFLYVALLFNLLLTADAVLAFRDEHLDWGHAGLGTLTLTVNAVLLWAYTLSCHSCRHIVGGRLNAFSRHPARYWAWTQVSKLNSRHMQIAWASLLFVALTDLYVRLVSSGTISDVTFF